METVVHPFGDSHWPDKDAGVVRTANRRARSKERIPALRILAGNVTSAPEMLAIALASRRDGVHFALALNFEDVRERLIRERSVELCTTYATWDEVRLMLDDYAGTIAEQRTTVSETERQTIFETMRLADSIVVRSWAEHARLCGAIGDLPRTVDVVLGDEPPLSRVAARQTDVVVYAPQYRADELAPFITALADFQFPVTIVASDAPAIAGGIRFELPHRANAALARARVIVDASNDSGVTLALASMGRPLAVSATGGAMELVRGVLTYELWNRRSILAAVANALGAAPPMFRAARRDEPPRERAPIAFGALPALVSVVVATYNRPDLLRTSLATIERQTYPQLEIVVVNDGGAGVDNVVAQFPRARLVECAANLGPAAARNRGLAAAEGTFVTFFDDDDEMFPDHIATLVNALLRSNLDVAYGQLINIIVPSAMGRHQTNAIAGQTALLDHADIQWAGSLAPTAVLFRRELVDRIGGLDESLETAEDYDFWLRLVEGRECARVDDVTSAYFIRSDGSNYSSRDVAGRYLRAHQAIYAKHPSLRPLVAAGRASMLEFFAG